MKRQKSQTLHMRNVVCNAKKLLPMIILHDLNNQKNHKECDLLEYELQALLIKHWDVFFPDYLYISKEFYLSGDVRQINKSGRIDILALNRQTNRFIIIEIKKEFDINIRSQAFDYVDYFIENVHELYLKASEIKNLPAVRDLDTKNVEILLIAKRFKDSDLKLAKSDNNLNLTLISYTYFSNNSLLLSKFDKEAKRDSKEKIKFGNIDNDIDNFWSIFNHMIELNMILCDIHFKLVKFVDEYSIYINIPSIYEKYALLCKEQNIPYLNLNVLRSALSCQDYSKGLIKSTRIGNRNSSAYIFDLNKMNDKIQINKAHTHNTRYS